MSLPVVEQLAEKIVARLVDITTENGYQHDVAGVVRPSRLGGVLPKDLLIVIDQGDRYKAEDADQTESNPLVCEYWQPWELNLYRRTSDSDTTPADRLVNLFQADVEKALTAPDNWHDWDGLAVESRFGDPV